MFRKYLQVLLPIISKKALYFCIGFYYRCMILFVFDPSDFFFNEDKIFHIWNIKFK